MQVPGDGKGERGTRLNGEQRTKVGERRSGDGERRARSQGRGRLVEPRNALLSKLCSNSGGLNLITLSS